MNGNIVLSRDDALRLRALLGARRAMHEQDREHLADLEHELDRAIIVQKQSLPADRVAVNSTVLARDIDSGVCRIYTLVLPFQADAGTGRVSILAPLGTALLGYRVGDEVKWRVPGGLLQLRIEAVRHANDPADESAQNALVS